jgi:hypothetical protein
VVGFECDPLHISPKKDWFVTSGKSASRARSCLDHGASFDMMIVPEAANMPPTGIVKLTRSGKGGDEEYPRLMPLQ